MPLISIIAKSVDEAWQLGLARVLKYGDDIKTEYDKPNDPPSKDASVIFEILEPFQHPMKRREKILEIKSKAGNKWVVYGYIADTYLIGSVQSNYIEEVVDGINDHFLYESGKSFPYSYHDRLFNYKPFALEDVNFKADNKSHHDVPIWRSEDIKKHQKLVVDTKGDHSMWEYRKNKYITLGSDNQFLTTVNLNSTDFITPIEFLDFPSYNQIDPIIAKLAESPYSRRAQASTWRPLSDQNKNDPPCLQRIWCRIINGRFKFQTTWRSRDLYRAWEANVNGMLYLQKTMLEKINDKIPDVNEKRTKSGKTMLEEVDLGTYMDFSNSLHIYGSNFVELLDLMERMKQRETIHPELEEQIEPLRAIVNKYKPQEDNDE